MGRDGVSVEVHLGDTVEEAMESILKLKRSKMSREYAMDEILVCLSMEDLSWVWEWEWECFLR